MRYLKKILLFSLFIFLAFNWSHDVIAMKRWDTRLLNVASHNFHSFLKIKWESRFKFYLACGADINARDQLGSTALHYAMAYLRYDAAKFLLENGADPNMLDSSGFTPLMRIVLASSNICPNTNNQYRFFNNGRYHSVWRSIMAALNDQPSSLYANPYQCKSIMELLIHYGAGLNVQDDLYSWTALMYAEDNRWLVNFLLKNGAEVNIQNAWGQTALRMATDKKIITALYKAGADVNIKDECGRTALHGVIDWMRIDQANLLIKYGASLYIADNKGKTPFVKLWQNLIHASKNNSIPEEGLALYVSNGGEIRYRDDENFSLLHYAVWRNKIKCLRMLLAYGADVMPYYWEDIPFLHKAAYKGNKGAIEVLITSPQGGPRQCHKDVASEEQILTFFLCLNRLFGGKKNRGGGERLPFYFPRQTRRNLFLPYLLPSYLFTVSEFINKVPLLKLKSYLFIFKDKGINTKELKNVLTERHIRQVADTLNLRDKHWYKTPLEHAQEEDHGPEITGLLQHDRESLQETFGKQIEQGYKSLLGFE